MKNRAVFLDRDGTINVDIGYVHKIKDLKFINGTFKALQILQELGFHLIIVTNQSGIGRGYYKISDFKNFNDKLVKELAKRKIVITQTFYCPHNPEKKCKCRKPQKLNYLKAAKKYDINIKKSYVIGDKTEDIKAGKNLEASTILVKTGKAGNDKKYLIKPDYIAKNLYEASKWIKKNIK